MCAFICAAWPTCARISRFVSEHAAQHIIIVCCLKVKTLSIYIYSFIGFWCFMLIESSACLLATLNIDFKIKYEGALYKNYNAIQTQSLLHFMHIKHAGFIRIIHFFPKNTFLPVFHL
jgi:hypothetical protein